MWVPDPCDLEFACDHGGNRLYEFDNDNDRTTYYAYDIDDPGTHGHANNRLMRYEVCDDQLSVHERARACRVRVFAGRI